MSASSARKWIELNWLRRRNKEIPLPEIIFDDLELCGGFYCHPQEKEIIVNDRFYDISRGIIVVDANNDDEFILNTLAHEWRHHWQYCKGIAGTNPPKYQVSGDYKSDIVRFFKGNWWELDALIFSIKKSPDETSLLWIDYLKESVK